MQLLIYFQKDFLGGNFTRVSKSFPVTASPMVFYNEPSGGVRLGNTTTCVGRGGKQRPVGRKRSKRGAQTAYKEIRSWLHVCIRVYSSMHILWTVHAAHMFFVFFPRQINA